LRLLKVLEQKKIVILGHSGFVGSHLEQRLLKNTCWSVVGKSLPEIDLGSEEGATKLTPYLCEDVVLVLAAAVKRQFGDSVEVFRKNMLILENIAKIIEQHPVRRIIYMSSAAVYGEETENIQISEKSLINPTSYYGINKYTGERLLRKACQANGMTSLVSLRPPLVYGPKDQGLTYGPAGFSMAALEGKPITLWGDGRELREFLFIEDLCHIIELFANNDFEGEVNTVSGNQYCFADIIDILRIKFPNLVVNSRPRSKAMANNAFNPQKIRSLLPENFCFTRLEDGIDKIVNQRLTRDYEIK
jgi:nucleoside-diphosphate-sugar epimerase